MKKIFFILVCLFTCLGIANAKTQIEYDWGDFYSDYVYDAKVYNDELIMLTSSKYWYTNVRLEKYDNNGEMYFLKENLEDEFYIFNDVIMSVVYADGKYYQRLYDLELNFIEENEMVDWANVDCSFYGESDKYYYIGINIFDKVSYKNINAMDIISTHSLFPQYVEEATNNEELKAYNTMFEIMKDLFPGTYLPLYFYENLYNNDSNLDIENMFTNGKDMYAVSFYNNDTGDFCIEIYDKEFNVLKTINTEKYIVPYILFKENYFYIFDVKSKLPLDGGDEESYYYAITEYDYNFVKKNEFDLSLLKKDEQINLEARPGRFFYNILPTKDGFILLTDVQSPNGIDEEGRQNSCFAMQKYSFLYNVETKKNDNGTVSVDKNSLKNGEIVTYNVKAKEGYKLDKVIVTDEYGNSIEIKDSTFTMPSSNVIVEAVFVVDNPNTGVFISIGASLLFIIATVGIVVLNRTKVQKYE